jgi:branched-chain amino acid aminotransferase
MTSVFLNGEFTTIDRATVSAFDAGLQHGVGLFETMLGGADDDEGPWIFRLQEHVERLCESARQTGLSADLRAAALADATLETVRRSGVERARVRLTVTGGDLNMLVRARERAASAGRVGDGSGPGLSHADHRPTVLIVAQPATRYPREMYERGVSVSIADMKVNPLDPLTGHKTLNYWPRLRELQVAAGKGCAEALVFQVTNFLSGGCVSSAFVVKDGRLITPIARGEETEHGAGTPDDTSRDSGERANSKSGGVALASPVLPGITREWVFDWANEHRVPVMRKMVTIRDVLGADEVFLTNSSWGVLPVVRVEAEAIAGGTVGRVSAGLIEAWSSQS